MTIFAILNRVSNVVDDDAAMARRHLVGSGLKFAGAAIVAGSLGTMGKGFFFPKPTSEAKEGFADSRCAGSAKGESAAGAHPLVLVAYASEFGTTGEVAEFIGELICRTGLNVRVQPVGDVQDLDQYSAVIIGGAIQFDKWMSEATDFVRQHEAILSQIPVSYFFTCMTLSEVSAKANTKADGYAEKVAATSKAVKPLSVGQFAGVLDYGRMALATLLASKAVYSILGVKQGDYRDWDAISAWTRSVV